MARIQPHSFRRLFAACGFVGFVGVTTAHGAPVAAPASAQASAQTNATTTPVSPQAKSQAATQANPRANRNAGTQSGTGNVYVMTNDPTANSIIQFARGADGTLTQVQEVPTGGMGGTGNGVGDLDPLGSADSLVLTNYGSAATPPSSSGSSTPMPSSSSGSARPTPSSSSGSKTSTLPASPAASLLLAVNAGSNQVTSLTTDGTTITVASNVDSGGVFPNSVAASGNIAYVLNAHTPNIVGFTIGSDGMLAPIDGAVFDVPGGTSVKAHDIRFSPDGKSLVVTDEGMNQLDVFALDDTGLVTGVTSTPAAGTGPFGFKFGTGGVLLSTEAASGSASTYALNSDGTLSVISGAVPDGQLATCWISLTRNGMFGFVSNTASGTLSTYHVAPGDGTLELANATSATLNGGGPIDSAISSDDAYLYVIDTVQGQVVPFRVTGAALHALAPVTGLPLTLQGIVAD